MKFRPCIDIHNGKVKQIVGSSLKDQSNEAIENFVSEQDSVFYANLYKKDNIKGGHIILLNAVDSEYYEATKQQALRALAAYPNGLQVGGGITAENAEDFIKAGASHVIVTSYVFKISSDETVVFFFIFIILNVNINIKISNSKHIFNNLFFFIVTSPLKFLYINYHKNDFFSIMCINLNI